MVEVVITATIAATTGRRASVVTLKRPVDGESLSIFDIYFCELIFTVVRR